MTDITAVHAALKARAASINSIAAEYQFWAGADNVLPDAEMFAFFVLESDRANFFEFGGGSGNNRGRVTGELQIFVAFPKPTNLETMLPIAETIAAIYRSYRPGSTVFCGEATAIPINDATPSVPGEIASVVGNYKWMMVIVDLYFDQVG